MHKSQNANNLVNIMQKVIIFALFFAIIAVFVYSLLLMTPFYDMYVMDSTMLFKSSSGYSLDAYGLTDFFKAKYEGIEEAFSYNPVSGKVNGMNMKYFTSFTRQDGIQVYNHFLFNFSLIGIVLSLVLFIYHSQKRERYYLTNFISVLLVIGFDFYVASSILVKGNYWENEVKKVDFSIINAFQSSSKLQETVVEYYSFEKVQWIFTVGKAIAVIVFVIGLLGLALLAYKFIYQRKHAEIDMSEVKVDE